MFFIVYYAMAVIPQRETIKKLMSDIVSEIDSWKRLEDESVTYIRRIERSCFNAAVARAIEQGISRTFTTVPFLMIYSEYCSKITTHLDPKSSINSFASHPTYFADLVASSSIDLNNIASLDTSEMQPETNAKTRNYIEARRNVKHEKKISKSYVCPKCKGNSTTFVSYQKRSSDEPETKSMTCMNEKCEHKWEI